MSDDEELAELEARVADIKRRRRLDRRSRGWWAARSDGQRALIAIVVLASGVVLLPAAGALFQDPPGVTPAGAQVASASSAGTETQRRIAAAIAARGGPPDATSGWMYDARTDPMTDAVTQFACARSTNNVNLGWPYGSVAAEMCVRHSARQGTDVFVALLDDGQILCRSYDGCTINVRFGDGPMQRFSAVGPSDLSTRSVFIQNTSRMIAGLKGADETRVELEFYQAGNQTVLFETAQLEWPRPSA